MPLRQKLATLVQVPSINNTDNSKTYSALHLLGIFPASLPMSAISENPPKPIQYHLYK